MIGLMILLFFGLYLAATIWLTRAAANWAKRNNRSQWRWGGLMAFVMYNLVFWDFIPTLTAHEYYCQTEAGFEIYQLPEQWKQENTEVSVAELKPFGKRMGDMPASVLNEGTPYAVSIRKINIRLYKAFNVLKIKDILPIQKQISYIADFKNNQKLAELVDFTSGYGNPMTTGGFWGFKKWLVSDGCNRQKMSEEESKYKQYLQKVIEMGEIK